MSNHLTSLHIFAKNTDAQESVKGFKYQELKTLEVWLHNFIHNTSEVVYCDYEDDIFQRNLTEFTSKFKQLKLYSSKNFSFSSIEVKKAMIHFFMLYINKEYLFDEVSFVFHTNSSIARQREDNGGTLLTKWAENQGSLKDEVLKDCISRVKSIIDDYIDKESQDQVDHNIKIAKEVYDKLPDELWTQFVQSIEWEFGEITSDEAMERTITSVFELIDKIKFPIKKEEKVIVFDRLRGVVSDKSIESEPNNRLLDSSILNSALLQLGTKEDKEYEKIFNLWKSNPHTGRFKIGEFYQCYYAAKYCRWNTYLEAHVEFWQNELISYYTSDTTPRKHKRLAAYELIWLYLHPSFTDMKVGTIEGQEEIINDFLSDYTEYSSPKSAEDNWNMISISLSGLMSGQLDNAKINYDQVVDEFQPYLEKCKKEANTKDELCQYLETELFYNITQYTITQNEDFKEESRVLIESILSIIDKANFYSVSSLGTKLEGAIDINDKIGSNFSLNYINDYSSQLEELILKREGEISLAKRHVVRGVKLLESTNPKVFLQTIKLFQKAKELYLSNDTMEGFILCLSNISQFYLAIGMTYAAKYYSLASISSCLNGQDEELYKRISSNMALVFTADFKHGAWISAMIDFRKYIELIIEFNPQDINIEKNDLLSKSLIDYAMIIELSPRFNPSTKHLVEHQVKLNNKIPIETITEVRELVNQQLGDKSIEKIIENNLAAAPVSDSGKYYNIEWKAFGSRFLLNALNDFITTSIVEEFVALFQIILTEILTNEIEISLIDKEVRINVNIVDKNKPIKISTSNAKSIEIELYLIEIKSKQDNAKRLNMGYITSYIKAIFKELSSLNDQDFEIEFMKLFKYGLGNKGLVTNIYQRIYREIYHPKEFADTQKSSLGENINKISCNENILFEKV